MSGAESAARLGKDVRPRRAIVANVYYTSHCHRVYWNCFRFSTLANHGNVPAPPVEARRVSLRFHGLKEDTGTRYRNVRALGGGPHVLRDIPRHPPLVVWTGNRD